MSLQCPHCAFEFKKLVIAGDEAPSKMPDLAPILCENCAEISLMVRGEIREMPPRELEALRQSPVWGEWLGEVQKKLREESARRKREAN